MEVILKKQNVDKHRDRISDIDRPGGYYSNKVLPGVSRLIAKLALFVENGDGFGKPRCDLARERNGGTLRLENMRVSPRGPHRKKQPPIGR